MPLSIPTIFLTVAAVIIGITLVGCCLATCAGAVRFCGRASATAALMGRAECSGGKNHAAAELDR